MLSHEPAWSGFPSDFLIESWGSGGGPSSEVLTVAVPTQLLEPLLGLLGDAGLETG